MVDQVTVVETHSLMAVTSISTIDDKNINLRIKNIKKHFFHFYKKTLKNMDKNIKLQYPFK